MECISKSIKVEAGSDFYATRKSLRGELAGFVADAYKARDAIREKKREPLSPARGAALQSLWADKQYDQDNRRALTLALAYLNRTPYIFCERNPKTNPSPSWIAQVLRDHGAQTTKEDIFLWMKPGMVREAAA